jgi:hypothetical protein
MPGRVRIKLGRDEAARGARLARRLASHPAVLQVSWLPAARSLTIEHHPDTRFADIMRTLPTQARSRCLNSRPVISGHVLLPVMAVAGASLGMGPWSQVVFELLLAPLVFRLVPQARRAKPSRWAARGQLLRIHRAA